MRRAPTLTFGSMVAVTRVATMMIGGDGSYVHVAFLAPAGDPKGRV